MMSLLPDSLLIPFLLCASLTFFSLSLHSYNSVCFLEDFDKLTSLKYSDTLLLEKFFLISNFKN